ncbi:MAG: pantetheine-phosphate adenylyltransferase [Alphaproteobacteria bacterium]|nr:pantetheine-phosphate adenylyltransferase [Alphaproteobacteria bacterium]
MIKERIGIYPGTFDPITKGHLHIIKRASKLVDRLIIGVAENAGKNPLFTHEERLKLVTQDIQDMMSELHCDIEVESFSKLLVDYAQEKGAVCVFRGLRAVSDFDYEFQMTGMNLHLAPEIETVFLMAADKWQFVSSSFIKEIHALGGEVEDFVTTYTLQALDQKRK